MLDAVGDTSPRVEALTGQFTEAQDDLASIRVSLPRMIRTERRMAMSNGAAEPRRPD